MMTIQPYLDKMMMYKAEAGFCEGWVDDVEQEL